MDINFKRLRRFIFIIFIWVLFIFTGIIYVSLGKETSIKSVKGISKKEITIKTEKIKIYFPTKDIKSIEKIEIEIPQSETKRKKIQKIISENLSILFEKGFLTTNKITPLNIYITEENNVYVDFNLSINELETENAKNLLIISSIVNSICEISDIGKVKFTINGKDGKKLLSKFYSKS
ncbi:MAG: GerMN domain-containing protein [Fusobacteriaceae bacterium]|nr:GerMN domain-containing protein [Fusobacteriaceae bacterium]